MEPPREFPFPFIPYNIQKDFMRSLYKAIEERKIGIFESPTGTGKSMSIICGALTWLRDFDKQTRNILQEKSSSDEKLNSKGESAASKDSGGLDWITEFVQKKKDESEKKEAKSQAGKLKSRDLMMKRILDGVEDSSGPRKKRAKVSHRNTSVEDEAWLLLEQAKRELENRDKHSDDTGEEIDQCDHDIILEEYHSDEESDAKSADQEEEEDDGDSGIQKIYYCSRTHSQLTQFIREIQKSPFNKITEDSPFHMTVVPLASRQSLCINESVRRLSSTQQINDKCLDMQKNSTLKDKDQDKENKGKRKKSSSSCPFKTASGIENLSEKILGKVQDIEEIVKVGKERTACPYYAAREAVKLAQLIVVPYQMLLHSSTRKASGIKLKDSVIIVDEAHNLVDTISNIHSIEVTCLQVQRAHCQLTQYVERFNKRLKAENLMYVKRILFILKRLLTVMDASVDQNGGADSIKMNPTPKHGVRTTLMTIHNFLFKANLDNINLFKVLRYCERSMISRKLNGFVQKYDCYGSVKKQEPSSLSKFITNAGKTQMPETSTVFTEDSRIHVMRSPLMHIENFLSSLTSANEDGRIAVSTVSAPEGKSPDQAKIRETASVKFLLLNPAAHFKEIVEECRCLIVAGGTMQPSSSFVNQLLVPLGVPEERIFEFSCGHVIDKDQLLPVVISQGPSGTQFDFTFENRGNLKLIDELGRTLSNLCNIIPGGIVCFFPSYDYEQTVHARWQETEILTKIGIKKKIFRESKKSSQVDHVLREYSACIQGSRSEGVGMSGALLLSVVGGKMSEGINFSDDLGRCVVMVGLPYPNLYSPELKEKMAYLDAHMPIQPKVGSKSAGQSYYENLCMKAVNQSIGRAIRHRNDHACILLADRRYARSNIKSQLPRWISDKLVVADRFGTAFGSVRKFFINKKAGRGNQTLEK